MLGLSVVVGLMYVMAFLSIVLKELESEDVEVRKSGKQMIKSTFIIMTILIVMNLLEMEFLWLMLSIPFMLSLTYVMVSIFKGKGKTKEEKSHEQ